MEQYVSNILGSASAGLIGRFICHPIDTCKAKLQSNNNFTGIIEVVTKTAKIEGIKGFYKGIGAVLVGGIPGICVYISTYELFKENADKYNLLKDKKMNFIKYLIGGMIAEISWLHNRNDSNSLY